MSRRTWLLIVVVAAFGSGCSGTPPSAAGSPTPSATSGSPSLAPMVPVEETSMAITVGHDERTVRLFVPRLGDGETAPLLLLLHGNNESTSAMADTAGAKELAGRETVIVAMPPGNDRRWEALIWPDEEIVPSPDVAFVSGLLAELPNRLPIDRDRVYVGGFSMGAVLADRLACESADLVTAIVVTSGTPWSDTCRPSRPVSVLVLHGTADTIFPVEAAAALADRWRLVNRCAGAPQEETIADEVVVTVSTECADGSRVGFGRIEGQPHRWFTDPNATAIAWRFFVEGSAGGG